MSSGHPMDDLHDRAAKALGWSASDVRSLSMQSLRDLVRPVDPDLAREMDYVIQSGAYIHGAPARKKSHRRHHATTSTSTKIWGRKEGGPWRLFRPIVALDEVTEWLEIYHRDNPGEEFVASPTKPTAAKAPKKIAKDIEIAVHAAQLYIGKGLTMRIADEQKLYRNMNRKIAAVAKRLGMDEGYAYQQIMAEAKRRGSIQAIPGKDI